MNAETSELGHPQTEHQLRIQLRSKLRCARLERIASDVHTYVYSDGKREDVERLRWALNAAGHNPPPRDDDD
jgi:hypothetical protein